MDFSFTEEQQMLLDSTRRWLSDHYTFDERRRIITSAEGRSQSGWQELSAMGLLSLAVPEADGGLGGGSIETLVVSMALGEALFVDPFVSSAILATKSIASLGSSEQRSRWLPALSSGELIAVLAHEEGQALRQLSARTVARPRTDGSWRISGHKAVVYHAPMADLLLVSAQVNGGGELGLFAIPRVTAGVTLEAYITIDGQRAADVAFDNVDVPAQARLGGDVATQLAGICDFGVAALCADALGGLQKLFEMTLEYCRTRVQFGQPVGRFQALQHRMADMLMHVEQARSMTYLAASRCESPVASERQVVLSAAKVIVGQASRFVGEQAVQLHGGMGVTDEMAVSHYFKRLLAFEVRFGSTAAHLHRYAAIQFRDSSVLREAH